MKISEAEFSELKYLVRGGTVVFPLYLKRLIDKGLITCSHGFHGRYNYMCELTEKAKTILMQCAKFEDFKEALRKKHA